MARGGVPCTALARASWVTVLAEPPTLASSSVTMGGAHRTHHSCVVCPLYYGGARSGNTPTGQHQHTANRCDSERSRTALALCWKGSRHAGGKGWGPHAPTTKVERIVSDANAWWWNVDPPSTLMS